MTWLNTYQKWLSPAESLQNAQKVVNFLYTEDKDWTKASISALIGNMRHESSINPNMYEYGKGWWEDRGFGLAQWTPRSKFWNWGSARGYSEAQLRSGDAQLARIDYEVANNIQYIANGHQARYGMGTKYNFSFSAFRSNSPGLSVNQLTEAFMWNYEGPSYSAGTGSLRERQAFANRAFNELNWTKGGSGGGDGGGGEDNPGTDDETPGGIDARKIDKIIEDGKIELIDSVDINLEKAINYIMEEFAKLFNRYVVNISQGFDVNSFFKITHTYKNQLKINPKPRLIAEMLKILSEGLKLIELDIDVDGVFNGMLGDLLGIFPTPKDPTPDPGPSPDPDPDPDPGDPGPNPVKKIFPVRIQGGVNFWKRSNWGVGTLQRNMTYGTRSSGSIHYGYDIGGGVTRHNIYSVTNGEVIKVGYMGGLGNYITIKNSDDRYYLEYGHLTSQAVKVGDTVRAGQLIGVMGDTGGNYAIHVDLKISTQSNGFYNWNTSIDPEQYLQVTADNRTSLPQP